MNYGNLKNRQTANMVVFRRFLCGFLTIFHYFDNFHGPKWQIWQIMGLEI